MYRDDRRFQVKSAGISRLAERQVDESLLDWADYVIVMEEFHKRKLLKRFPEKINAGRIFVLHIPDIYYYMDRTLMREIKEGFEEVYRLHIE